MNSKTNGQEYVLGVDVGGTTVKIGVFSEKDGLLDKWEIRTRREDSGAHILSDIAASVTRYLQEKGLDRERLKGAGIGIPGAVLPGGIVDRCVNLGWGTVPVSEVFSGLMGGIPVQTGNDANVAALGEMWKGGGRGYRNLVMVTLGTGVGGGVILDGKIVTSAFGAAGEIGHLQMREDEEECCGCGKKGCLEQYASATGIVRMTKKYLASSDEPSALRDQKQLTAKAIFDSAREGDGAALCLVGQLGEMLGRALSYISAVIDPEIFVLGGGVSRAGSILLDTVAENYRKCAFHASRKAKFELASLGNDAGIYGAARMVME